MLDIVIAIFTVFSKLSGPGYSKGTFQSSSQDVTCLLGLWIFQLLKWNCNCNCNYILFTKLPCPGVSEGTFRSSSQAATCQPVYHTRRRLHTVPFNAERQAGKLWISIFIVFGLTQPGIEPKSTASVADALSTQPLKLNSLVLQSMNIDISSISKLIFHSKTKKT